MIYLDSEKIDEINLNCDSRNFFKSKIPKTLPLKSESIKIIDEKKYKFVFYIKYKIKINSINSSDGIIIDKNNEKINENTLEKFIKFKKEQIKL